MRSRFNRGPIKGYQIRPLELITEYTIHHEASNVYINDPRLEDTVLAAANYHWNLGWPAIGYHFLYSPKFHQFAWVGDFNTIRYHAAGERDLVYNVGVNNVRGLGICIAGDYSRPDTRPDDQTLADVMVLIEYLEKQLPQGIRRRVVGHLEVSPTQCPGGGWLTTWKNLVVPQSLAQ